MRRTLLAAPLFLALALPLARAGETSEKPAPTPPPYDWGVAYYMSYDNDLEGCGEPIMAMIKEGVTSERTVAAVQADFTDPGGMRRVTITSKGREETRIDSEDSADQDRVIEYLEWFVKTFRCRRYAFIFLDHGGTIDAMCNDQNPATPGRHWMSGRRFGERLRRLRAGMDGRLELLFLQQCGRGSLENLFSFRGTADFIMSSPVPVGAPNTYYAAFQRWLGENPDATGDALAKKIAAEDRDYSIYTCLKTSALEELPKRLDQALKPFLAKKSLAPPGRLRVIHPAGEPIVDAKAFLVGLATKNGIDEAAVTAFFKWVDEDLFTMVERRSSYTQNLCGLSIFAATNPAEAARYRALDLYKQSRLPALLKLLASGAAPKSGQRVFER